VKAGRIAGRKRSSFRRRNAGDAHAAGDVKDVLVICELGRRLDDDGGDVVMRAGEAGRGSCTSMDLRTAPSRSI